MMFRTARYALEEEEITVSNEDCVFPDDDVVAEEDDLSQFVAGGTLTPEALNAHLAGISWQIQVRV